MTTTSSIPTTEPLRRTAMNRTSIRGLGARTLALVAVLLTALLAWAPSASAYVHVTGSGNPGAVQAYRTLGTHLQVPCGAVGYYNCFAPGLTVSGPVVYRSPASTGTQYVKVRYTVFRWNGSGWYIETTRDFSGTINAGQTGVALPAWNVLTTSGHKQTGFSIVWTDAYGRALATSAVSMNGNDYACSTRFTYRCSAHTGSVAVWTP